MDILEKTCAVIFVAILVIGIFSTYPACGGDYTVNVVKDRHGIKTGTIEQRPNGEIVIKDRHGIKTGTIESKDGALIVKDRWGIKRETRK